MRSVGFTGTRNGMTQAQRDSFRTLIAELNPNEFHHGDCIGADAEAHDLVRELVPNCKIVVHPPVDREHRAFKSGDETRDPRTHLARNRDIVNDSEALVGVSVSAAPLERGGTWYTIDFAVKKSQPVWVVWPDGHTTQTRNP